MKSTLPLAIFWTAFVTAYVAELGCLVRTGALVLSSRSPFWVVLGTLAGNVAVVLPLLLFGEKLLRLFPSHLDHRLHQFAGLVFVLLGLWMLFSQHSH